MPPPAKPADKPATDKPKDAPLTEDQLAGVKSLFASEFPNTKFNPPPGEKPAKEGEEPETPEEKTAREAEEEVAAAEANKRPEMIRDEHGHFVKKAPVAKKPAAKPVATKPKPAAVAAAAPPVAPMDPEKIAEAAARGVVKGMEESKTKDETTKAKSLEESLSPSDKRKVEVLRHLATLNPDKYKDVADTFIKGAIALKTYAKQWEKDHPGQEFDPESPEHEDFFEKSGAVENWDEDDYIDAVADMRVQKAMGEKEKASPADSARVEALEKKLRLLESSADIGKKQTAAAVGYWGLLGDDFADMVAENGAVNQTKLNELKQKQPGSTEVMLQAARALNTEVGEITKVYEGLVTFAPKTNVVHRAIEEFGAEMESAMEASPPEQRLNQDGKPWAPSLTYNKMTDEQRAQCWTLGAEDLIALRTQRMAKLVKDSIAAKEKAFRDEAKARGIEIPEAEAAAAEEPGEEPPPARAVRSAKPVSPSSAPDTRGAATRAGRGAAGGNGQPTVSTVI